MAEVEILPHLLGVVSQFLEVDAASSVSAELTSATLAKAFQAIAAVLVLIGDFLPGGKNEEILIGFKGLNNKIDQMRNDMKDLERMIKWEITELQYGDAMDRIDLGFYYFLEILNTSETHERIRYENRLKELCANENCALALKALFDGTTGNGRFKRNSIILDKFYHKTGGNLSRISALAGRLLQLEIGGFLVVATYETMMRGKEGAEEITTFFTPQFNETFFQVQSVYDRCKINFRENMLSDLNKKLDEGKSNEDLVTEISELMRYKYDWLENYVLVYNDLQGYDKHRFEGDRVDSLHRNGKCGIVFYRPKDEPPTFSSRYEDAYKIVNEAHCAEAGKCYKKIVATIDDRGIGWTGCAVITMSNPSSVDLRMNGTFSTKIVYIFKNGTHGMLRGSTKLAAKAILLLK